MRLRRITRTMGRAAGMAAAGRLLSPAVCVRARTLRGGAARRMCVRTHLCAHAGKRSCTCELTLRCWTGRTCGRISETFSCVCAQFLEEQFRDSASTRSCCAPLLHQHPIGLLFQCAWNPLEFVECLSDLLEDHKQGLRRLHNISPIQMRTDGPH